MFEALSVYFQCVNERATHVKIDHVSRWCRPGAQLISNFSCYRMSFDHLGSINENKKKKLWEYKDDFLVFL